MSVCSCRFQECVITFRIRPKGKERSKLFFASLLVGVQGCHVLANADLGMGCAKLLSFRPIITAYVRPSHTPCIAEPLSCASLPQRASNVKCLDKANLNANSESSVSECYLALQEQRIYILANCSNKVLMSQHYSKTFL
jgi:hypothetical protein